MGLCYEDHETVRALEAKCARLEDRIDQLEDIEQAMWRRESDLKARVAELEAGVRWAFMDGRNVLPDASDDQASVIESWALALLPEQRVEG